MREMVFEIDTFCNLIDKEKKEKYTIINCNVSK